MNLIHKIIDTINYYPIFVQDYNMNYSKRECNDKKGKKVIRCCREHYLFVS